jgi:hypothetical protein
MNGSAADPKENERVSTIPTVPASGESGRRADRRGTSSVLMCVLPSCTVGHAGRGPEDEPRRVRSFPSESRVSTDRPTTQRMRTARPGVAQSSQRGTRYASFATALSSNFGPATTPEPRRAEGCFESGSAYGRWPWDGAASLIRPGGIVNRQDVEQYRHGHAVTVVRSILDDPSATQRLARRMRAQMGPAFQMLRSALRPPAGAL